MTQSSNRLPKFTRIRPTCSQTETSSRAALDVSTALKYCTSQVSTGKEACGIHDTSFQNIMKCDVYTCKESYNNVVLSGGTTVFQWIVRRMTQELTDRFHDDHSSLRPKEHGHVPTECGAHDEGTDRFFSRWPFIRAAKRHLVRQFFYKRIWIELERAFPLRCMREVTGLHLEFCQRDVTDDAATLGTFCRCGMKDLSGDGHAAQKTQTAVQPFIGLGFPIICMENVDHDAVCGLRWTRVQQRDAPNRSATVCVGAWANAFVNGSTHYVYVRNESERLFIEMSLMKESKAECAMVRALSSAKGMCSAVSEYTQASSETSVLLDLTTIPLRNWCWTASDCELSLCSAAVHYVSYDFCFFFLLRWSWTRWNVGGHACTVNCSTPSFRLS